MESTGSVLDDRVLACPGPQDIRWRPGERLEHLFQDRCDRLSADGHADHLAVDAMEETLTYRQLDGRANQLARYLLSRGVGSGHRVALLFDRAVPAYVAVLGVLKSGAAYVPLDVAFPRDRLSYILADAGVSTVLTFEHLRPHVEDTTAELVCVDASAPDIDAHDAGRLPVEPNFVDGPAYIIYTSGSTGRPKGVAISHSSICNFVRVAAMVYGYRPDDRVYQGLTMAFDFSVEEIWVPWLVGATLVPKPSGSSLLGVDLHEFLVDRRVTAMCCVPTLLATIDDELPALRFLLVSGEACPHDLIVRWSRPGRRFLNVYGPTEATVTATWTVVDPDRPVTIGVPLPTYATVILDPEDPGRALGRGEVGEIGIAGIGLAIGYVNREDLTEERFVPDFLAIPHNPSGRIYRTGDLGRVNADGEMEYLGRIDLQVKIRGYRIELTEIESVLLEVPGIAQAVVETYEPVPGTVELAGYYTVRRDTAEVDPVEVHAVLRDRLPAYMVPAYLQPLDFIPMTTSDKADRKNLPLPTMRLGGGRTGDFVPPTCATEAVLAGIMARSLGVQRVSIDSHFFDELGANSVLMAQFSGRVRKETDLPPVSIKDVYLNPTVRGLAHVLDAGVADAKDTAPDITTPTMTPALPPVGSTPRYVLCGALQLLLSLATLAGAGVLLTAGLGWVLEGAGDAVLSVFGRALVFCTVAFVLSFLVPVAAKWLLVGRWRPQEFPIWSLRYVRFWFVKTLIRVNPMVLFAGSPLYLMYLRALGARVGRGVAVFSRKVPACPDLLTIGDGTVIRNEVAFSGYRAVAGHIEIGRIDLGRDVVVGDASVLDVDTAMGDGAQLGHASSLQSGQAVPAGQRRHGSPAEPTTTDYRLVEPRRCGSLRRFVYSTVQVVNLLVLFGPLLITLIVWLFTRVPGPAEVLGPGHSLAEGTLYGDAMLISTLVLLAVLLLGLAVVLTVPRLLALATPPDVVVPLYGARYWASRVVRRMTNTPFTRLLGDSAFVTHFLSVLGYDLSRVEQTGSNFGLILRHETPYLTSVGTGSMISDGLMVANIELSGSSFRLRRVSIGERNFLGNHVTVPTGSRVGDNCLVATRAMVPIEGAVRHDVGLLGSPPFEIPRSVQRDGTFDHLRNPEELSRRLAAKTRHNTVSIVLHLLVMWFLLTCTVLAALAAADLYRVLGAAVLPATVVLVLLLVGGTLVFAERAATGFRAMEPRFCSIYQPYFWRHERFWKLTTTSFFDIVNGTPMKGPVWRLLGLRVGRRLFDDGSSIPEKSLVTIGDDCTLNAGSALWCHTLEDGTFKSDRIRVGDRCTLGVTAFVLYGTTLGDGSELHADSFLMKGEEVPPSAHYRGNPARETRESTPGHRPRPARAAASETTAMLMAAAPMAMAGVVSVALLLSVTAAVALSTGATSRSAPTVPVPSWPPSTDRGTPPVPAVVPSVEMPELPPDPENLAAPALPPRSAVGAGSQTREPSVRTTPPAARVPAPPARTPLPARGPERTTGGALPAQPKASPGAKAPPGAKASPGPRASPGPAPSRGPQTSAESQAPRESEEASEKPDPTSEDSESPSRSAPPSDEPDAPSAEPEEPARPSSGPSSAGPSSSAEDSEE
ncbi:Pls/PosA family non-ribosomal peptide synthetase [Pseudonocardia xinjiangensis]|uniref:Pls/PosA family non-ribosomal peptide synthetase n=1 Tax=Pseudonocardia xinjiangensis TaxID=75289 RepID=UPI0028AC46A5|nr:Pls/PosA family non-ribosomal peptide synthetase [Pseudonocardia xinjiangensis]